MGGWTRLVAGAFLCASPGSLFLVEGSDGVKTFNLPNGGSLNIEVTRRSHPGGSISVSAPGSTSMSFPGVSGSYGGYSLTDSVEISSGDEPPVVQHITLGQGGAGFPPPSFGRITPLVAGAPTSTSQIMFGWVPDPDAASASLGAQNISELNNALRSAAFVNKLRTRAIVEKSCSIPVATDRQSYLEIFWGAVDAERRFREAAEEQRKVIEDELHQNQMASPNMTYARSVATRANLERGETGAAAAGGGAAAETENDTAAALRYQETVDRIFGSRVEILLTCKLAALLGQPHIFLSDAIKPVEALEMVATALGLGDVSSTPLPAEAAAAAAGAARATAGPMFGGLEPFLVASNPLTTGHILTLLIGYIDRDAFFGSSPRKSFYNFTTLVGATGGESGILMLDEMCDRDRGPRYKTSLLARNRRKDRQGRPTARGSSKPWFVRGTRRQHKNKNQPELLRAYCDATEMILNAVMTKQEDIQEEMLKYSLPVEPLVDPATNAARIQTRTCRGEAAVCEFDNSILSPVASPLDPAAIDQNTTTRSAFNLYAGLASAQIGNMLEDGGSRYYDTRAEQWMEIISKPAANNDILEKAFYYDNREMISKNKSAIQKAFDAFARRITALAGKASVSFSEATTIFEAIQKDVAAQRPRKWYKREPPINKKNLFRVAVILFLKSRLACDMRSSFAEKFEAFTQFLFKSREAGGRRQPALQRSLLAFFRTNKAQSFYAMCSFDPLSLSYLFLYRFVLMGSDAGRTHDKQHAAVSRTRLSTRLLGSKWTPSILKSVMMGFKRKSLVQTAKQLLLESLDPSILSSLLTSFDWIVHTQATLQVNQSASMYHDLEAPSQQYKTTGEKKEGYRLSSGGLVKTTDKQLEDWAEYGIPASLSRKLRRGEKLPKSVAFEKIATPDLTKWEQQLNNKWLDALGAYLEHPYGRAALAARDPVALLVKESKDRLEAEVDSTIFLGRVVKVPRMSKFKKAMKAISNFFRAILRAPEQSEYAVWMGVKVNVDKVLAVMKAVNNAAEVAKSSGVYEHIREAFLEIVKDFVMGNLDSHVRIVGYDTFAAIDEQLRTQGYAAANKRNHGFLAIHPDYSNMSEAERKREFQLSMCMDHCESVWSLITSLVLTNLQNPKKLKDYEVEMSKTKAIAALNDPNRVNAFRFGLNVQTDYFENLLDKGSRENIKRMKFGGGTWFAYSLLLAGRINTAMGMPNLGTTLVYQAPYYGNFILRWIKERREARKKALFAMLTLGFFFAYTFLSVSDITQHLNDSGLGPAVDCLENLIVGPICPAEVIAPAITSAATAAAQDVFKVGLLGLLTPYLVWPMMLISVWQILKSEFKVLLQFEMSVKSLFTRFSRWAKQPFTTWWQKRRRMKESIMKNASDKYEQEKIKNKGKEPQARDFIGRLDTGAADLDILGLPSSQQQISYEITWGSPVFPYSPPLIQASSSGL